MKQVLLFILYSIYRLTAWAYRPPEVSVLMYHSIGANGWGFSTDAETFERQLRSLRARGIRFLSPDEVVAIARGEKAARRGVLLTFDDGYRDFAEVALPILRKYNAPALLFVHSDRSANMLGTDIPLLSLDELSAVRGAGVEIGSHSHAHPNFRTLSSDDTVRDLQEAHRVLSESLGVPPRFFAYPEGKGNPAIPQFLVAYDYRAAFSIDRGLVAPGINLWRLPRNGIDRRTSWIEFLVRTSAANAWYERIVHIFRPLL